jgi:hypothetical protein
MLWRPRYTVNYLPRTLQVRDGHIRPVPLQILSHQAPVAVFGRRLTAQQYGGHAENGGIKRFCDPSLFQ